MSTRAEILRLLADGQFHSGTDVGRMLGISRAAVCKGIKSLTQRGVDIHRLSGRGYRLQAPFRPLEAEAIMHHLPASSRFPLYVLDEVDSTNQYLLRLRDELVSGSVCLAEAQSAGRGRRGRGWASTPYSNILMSIAWRFDAGPAALAGLSLAAGVTVVEALRAEGVEGIGLKWPNDVLARGRKLAGLLVDVRGEMAGPCWAVLGLGLNVHLGEREAAQIAQPWIDLRALQAPADRNRLASVLIAHLHAMFARFEREGLAPFLPAWQAHHTYAEQAVRLLQGEVVHEGTIVGVDGDGALLVRTALGVQRFNAGEISLRAAHT